MKITILGLSLTSSWGNGHATTYRALIRGLTECGHQVTFLEHNKKWYADHRDLPCPPHGVTHLYESVDELKANWSHVVSSADLVILGSYVPEGIRVAEWLFSIAGGVTAFYDIDTPVTIAKLEAATNEYLSRDLIPKFDLYLSFTGGPVLDRLERVYNARRARPLYCSVDAELYSPETVETLWDLGYLGTYSADRQPTLSRLMLQPAKEWPAGRFAVAGAMYPEALAFTDNVQLIDHLPPSRHRQFYCAQRWTLNVTRADMIRAGYSPSVRLFEAAACGAPIISDRWDGMGEILDTRTEIVLAATAQHVLKVLKEMPEDERLDISRRARARVLSQHTCQHRATQLEGYISEVTGSPAAAKSSKAAR